ncbi:MAG: hypothetical protein JWM80_739 [Cyanobacteria bacterium RYN_339]|nr:hypothetical protein [Cyanobacteria bacterium RYN_339]
MAVLGALFLAYCFAHYGLASDDELLILSAGRRVADGQVPYRDFFEFVGPLPITLAAVIYKVVGSQVLVARWAQLGLLVVATMQAQRLAGWLGMGPWLALLPAWLVLGSFYRYVPGFNHHWLALPLLLAALLAGLRAAEDVGLRWWAVAGAWAGLTTLCLVSDGLVVCGALAAYALLHGWLAGHPRPAAARRLGALALGLGTVLGVTALALASVGALGAAFADVVLWPASHYRNAGGINDVRYLTDLARAVGPMGDTRLAVPSWYLRQANYLGTALVPPLVALACLAWGLGLLAGRWSGRLVPLAALRYGLVGLATIGCTLGALRGRADVEHLAFDALPAFLVLGGVTAWLWARATAEWRWVAVLPILAWAGLLAGGLAQTAAMLSFQHLTMWSGRGPDVFARQDATLNFIRARAWPGDRLVAVPSGGYYYFYGLPPAVRMTTVFSPAANYYDTAELAGFWREVATSGARFLVVDPSNEPFMRDAFPGPPPGYRPVFAAPSQRYAGPWVTVYERRANPDPTR